MASARGWPSAPIRQPRSPAARGKALEARAYLQEDPPRDPRDAIAGRASAMTVAALVPLYLDKPHRRTGRPRKSIKEVERRLTRTGVARHRRGAAR